MNCLITGASGLVGSALAPRMRKSGYQIIELRRGRKASASLSATWQPDAGQIDLSRCGAIEAVIHLAGETIAQRWTPAAKARIRDSRVDGTRLLVDALAKLPVPPRIMVCASATGYYGDRGDEKLDENSPPGAGFLAEVAQAWEAAASPLNSVGTRVVLLRLGVVITPKGGALAKMLPMFRLGLGGRLSHGRQYWSWITLEDLLATIEFCLVNDALTGPVNAVSPYPETNREFTRALARSLHRPAILPVPAIAIRMLLGQMGQEALLASARVIPGKLTKHGFPFRHAELDKAFQSLLSNQA